MNKNPIPFVGQSLLTGLVALLAIGCISYSGHAAAKRVLVVTTTMGFRHSSIPTAEKVLGELATQSGVFTVDYARVEPNDPQFKGADGKPDKAKVEAAIKAVLAEKMSAAALKNYDAVIFANTTGGKGADLPLPDQQAFLDWIKAGHGFIGMHSATDTFRCHVPLDPYVEMIGGEFKTHGAQAVVDCLNQDAQHPACAHLGGTLHLKDEIYILNGFDRTKVHDLLSLDKHPNNQSPGHYPIAWCKMYGQGRVFYTSLGHREDVWDANTPASFKRENPPEIALAYQKHILGGIKWALGLEKGDATPQTK
jgi:uncharacterized protein